MMPDRFGRRRDRLQRSSGMETALAASKLIYGDESLGKIYADHRMTPAVRMGLAWVCQGLNLCLPGSSLSTPAFLEAPIGKDRAVLFDFLWQQIKRALVVSAVELTDLYVSHDLFGMANVEIRESSVIYLLKHIKNIQDLLEAISNEPLHLIKSPSSNDVRRIYAGSNSMIMGSFEGKSRVRIRKRVANESNVHFELYTGRPHQDEEIFSHERGEYMGVRLDFKRFNSSGPSPHIDILLPDAQLLLGNDLEHRLFSAPLETGKSIEDWDDVQMIIDYIDLWAERNG